MYAALCIASFTCTCTLLISQSWLHRIEESGTAKAANLMARSVDKSLDLRLPVILFIVFCHTTNKFVVISLFV